MSRLALGGAQFGLDYGITNLGGRVQEHAAAAILQRAARGGVDTIDTARSYGESEAVIGRQRPDGAAFRIVTKTAKFSDSFDPEEAVRRLHSDFRASQEALGDLRLHGLLLHDAADLLGPIGPVLWSALEKLKRLGSVQKVGVSAYEPGEIDRILDRYPIDIIQVPFNALDRRLSDGGQLGRLASANVEIHARSIFLQGLLLAPSSDLPGGFEPLHGAFDALDDNFKKHGLSRLEGLLSVVLSRPQIDRFVIGVTSVDELDAVLAAEKRAAETSTAEIPDLPQIDHRYLNPSRWSELQ